MKRLVQILEKAGFKSIQTLEEFRPMIFGPRIQNILRLEVYALPLEVLHKRLKYRVYLNDQSLFVFSENFYLYSTA